MAMQEKTMLVGAAVVYKINRGKTYWFLVKNTPESELEIAKTNVRRGESSVRAVIRATGEQGGMRAKVLEEVGRSGGTTTVNNKVIPQRTIYYLMLFKDGGEAIGYASSEWHEYSKAVKKVSSKKDQSMLRAARDLIKELEKKRKAKLRAL